MECEVKLLVYLLCNFKFTTLSFVTPYILDYFFAGPNNDHEIDLHSLASEEDFHDVRSNGLYAAENGHYTGENKHYTGKNRLYTSDSGHYTSENEPFGRESYLNGNEPLDLVNGDNGEDHHDNSYSTILSSRPMSISESIQEPLDPEEVKNGF